MGLPKHWDEITAISRYCLIVFLWMAFSKNMIISHWLDLLVALPFWCFQNNLASGAKRGFCHQIWRFNAFLGFSCEDGVYRIYLGSGDLKLGMSHYIFFLFLVSSFFILFHKGILIVLISITDEQATDTV